MAAPVSSCPTISEETRHDLIMRLYKLGCINFSGVVMKTGEVTPFYFDVRLTMSDPVLMRDLSREMYRMVETIVKEKFDLVVGVPAAAIALATNISLQNTIPQILCRKSAKDYGTKKVIEGIWKKHQNVLIVEDVVAYGSSIEECAKLLREHELKVCHACVVIERQQGGTQQLLNLHGVHLHSLLTFDDILSTLLADGLITPECVESCRRSNAFWQYETVKAATKPAEIKFCPKLTAELSGIVSRKATNICLKIDTVISVERLLEVLEIAGPFVAAVQLNMNFLSDCSSALPDSLRNLAAKYNFILIGDFNLSVDEKTASLHLHPQNHLKLHEWCHAITVHGLTGDGVLEALRKHNAESRLPIAALITIDHVPSLGDLSYQKLCFKQAQSYEDVCLGFSSANPIEGVSHVTNSHGVPNFFYVIPTSSHHRLPASEFSNEDTFGHHSIGVLVSVGLDGLKNLAEELPLIAKES